jgi:hypothetical protein
MAYVQPKPANWKKKIELGPNDYGKPMGKPLPIPQTRPPIGPDGGPQYDTRKNPGGVTMDGGPVSAGGGRVTMPPQYEGGPAQAPPQYNGSPGSQSGGAFDMEKWKAGRQRPPQGPPPQSNNFVDFRGGGMMTQGMSPEEILRRKKLMEMQGLDRNSGIGATLPWLKGGPKGPSGEGPDAPWREAYGPGGKMQPPGSGGVQVFPNEMGRIYDSSDPRAPKGGNMSTMPIRPWDPNNPYPKQDGGMGQYAPGSPQDMYLQEQKWRESQQAGSGGAKVPEGPPGSTLDYSAYPTATGSTGPGTQAPGAPPSGGKPMQPPVAGGGGRQPLRPGMEYRPGGGQRPVGGGGQRPPQMILPNEGNQAGLGDGSYGSQAEFDQANPEWSQQSQDARAAYQGSQGAQEGDPQENMRRRLMQMQRQGPNSNPYYGAF